MSLRCSLRSSPSAKVTGVYLFHVIAAAVIPAGFGQWDLFRG